MKREKRGQYSAQKLIVRMVQRKKRRSGVVCETGKIALLKEQAAQELVRAVNQRQANPQNSPIKSAYFCAYCGTWHLTSKLPYSKYDPTLTLIASDMKR